MGGRTEAVEAELAVIRERRGRGGGGDASAGLAEGVGAGPLGEESCHRRLGRQDQPTSAVAKGAGGHGLLVAAFGKQLTASGGGP